MESYKSENNNESKKSTPFEKYTLSLITASLVAAGVVSIDKKDEEVPKIDQSEISNFFNKPAEHSITKSYILIKNAVDYGSLQTSLDDYKTMIKNSPENESKSLTNGEYLAIQARAIEIANQKGVEVGDVLSVPVENWNGPSEIKYIGSIDIGDHITKKVVPPTFNKVYVKMSEDTKTLDFLEDNIKVIAVSDDDELLTPEEKNIRLSVE